MKILVRCLGCGISLILAVMLFMQMADYNVRLDELNNVISTAMSSTQVIMKEQIEDECYQTNNRRKTIHSNKEYVEEFANNFYKLVSTNSKYTIKIIGVDYTKGFLDVQIDCSFYLLNGNEKTFSSRKTSLIENREKGES